MNCRRLFVVCICMVVFFSCRKTIATEEMIVAPIGSSQNSISDESKILRVPGNYQSWQVAAAPMIVSVDGNGEYEGYINFNLENTEFWLVKGTAWENVLTYNETGNHTFGHNGTFFKLPTGAGVYKMNASTNSFTWSCTKVNDWSIVGSAVAGVDEKLVFNPGALSWSVTKNLAAGDFVFRANKTNEIVFGHNPETQAGVLNYNGARIQLKNNGNYTIVLSLKTAGAYSYSIKRNF